MMRTEHDIRDALDAKAAEAADQVSLPVSRPRSLRRVAPVLGAIAAAAAVAVTVSVVATGGKTTHTAAAPPHRSGCGAAATQTTVLRYDFRVVDVPAPYRSSPGVICSAMQQVHVTLEGIVLRSRDNPDGPFPQGSVTMFSKSAFDPTAVEKGRRVTVQGHRGYFGDLPVVGGSLPVPKSVPTLVWEYARDSWAVVQAAWSPNQLAGAQLLAAHVRIGELQPIPIPFKLGWVPDGLVAAGAVGDNVGLSDRTPAKSADCTTASCGSAMSVGVYQPGVPDGPHAPGTRRIRIDGHDAIIYPHASELDVGFGDRTLLIRVDPNHLGKFSDQDLIKIAQNVTMSPNMTDPSTWFDATTVVPH
jgi:hypothetical protein